MTAREEPARGRSSPRPGRVDPEVHAVFSRVLSPIGRRLWPADVRGLENLPSHDRFVVIANHSGLGPAELFSLLVDWTDRFGDGRPLAGMAHPAGFLFPHLRPLLHAYGAVEATRDGARWARSHQVPLLLFPGGDREAFRPLARAREVDFFGRKGWIRLARELDLDVVPLCISNSHHTLPVLPIPVEIGAWLTGVRALGVKRVPIPAHAAALAALAARALRRRGASLPVSVLAAYATLVATYPIPVVPARIGFDVLPPVPRADLEASDDVVYQRVVGALQAAMDARA